MNRTIKVILILMFVLAARLLPAQTIYQYKRADANVLFFNKGVSQYIPHIVREYEYGKALHTGIWNIDTVGKAAIQPPLMLVCDWQDDANAGVSAIPKNVILMEMSPLNMSYFVAPSNERYTFLFRHEYTHVAMTDKTSASDRRWRSFLGGKFSVDANHPFSAIWSYMACPRWYAPRWYHEGIACFMETWLDGGIGRSLGGYDEMYFRSVVDAGEPLFSVVGLETGGNVSDFQGGINSYLYGTRFVNYLEYQYGLDKLLKFYNRTDESRSGFNHQFKKVYGESLRKVWDDWRKFEVKHQKEQMAAVSEFPLTETEKLSEKSLGSMSPMALDEENGCGYVAVNYPGDFPHLEKIDLKTLKRTKLHMVDNPMSYQTSYLTLDKKRQRLIYTTQNTKYRGLRVFDLKRKVLVKKLNYQRVSEIDYDNVNDCMYGIYVNNGSSHLCKYDPEFEKRDIIYSFPFGISVFDLDVSESGKYLTVTTNGSNGLMELLCFDLEKLQKGDFSYETLYSTVDFNLGQFHFAPGDSTLIGSSYYTGVSNIWRLDRKTKEFSLLSNTKTGMFSPEVLKDGRMLALEFDRNGLRPVRFNPEVLEDANAIELLGQKAYNAHPEELEALSEPRVKVPDISFGEVYDSIRTYKPINNMVFTGAYPEISGFTDKGSWNNMTPVLGYHMTFSDPLGLNKLDIDLGISPWSRNDAVNQYHARIEWKYWLWKFTAAFNPTSFYDLVGPLRTSRKGWQVGVSYDRSFDLLAPASQNYGFSVNAYGMMDELPLYQDTRIDEGIHSFQTASAYYQYSKTRSTVGGVMAEQGIVAGAQAYTYLAGGKFYPTLQAILEYGFPIPGLRNTCFWLRSAVGQNFGDAASSFGNEYFGGFGNNWLDYRAANRYRNTSSFAGLPVSSIPTHSFAKLLAELSLRPIRYNDFGAINIYPTYTQFNIFGSGLVSNPWEGGRNKYISDTKAYYNVGIQVNTEVILFKFMKTTWSLGYARAFLPDGTSRGDWLFSLKIF